MAHVPTYPTGQLPPQVAKATRTSANCPPDAWRQGNGSPAASSTCVCPGKSSKPVSCMNGRDPGRGLGGGEAEEPRQAT